MKRADMNTTAAGVVGALMLLWTQAQPLLHTDWRHVNYVALAGAVLSAVAGYKAADSP